MSIILNLLIKKDQNQKYLNKRQTKNIQTLLIELENYLLRLYIPYKYIKIFLESFNNNLFNCTIKLHKMSFLNSLILLICFFVYQTQADFRIFCYTTCKKNTCTNYTYNKCTQCDTGFMKDPNNTQSGFPFPASCITATVSSTSTGAKYIPVGATPDVNYDLKSPTSVSTLSVLSTAANQSTCAKDQDNNYTFYGDLNNADSLTIKHMTGVADMNVHFWMVRIRGGIITKDRVSNNAVLTINFTTNITQPVKNILIDPGSEFADNKICDGDTGSENQRYQVFVQQFLYNDTASLQFVLKVISNPLDNPWGIMHFIVQVRLCHLYCLSCFGDSFTSCYSCNFVYQNMTLSGTTCALTCLNTYGYNQATPGLCILCQANCSSCYNVETNCTLCLTSYFLLDDGVNVSCVNPCPSHYYANQPWTGPNRCLVCDANCLNCTITSTRCISCYPGFFLYNQACYNPCPTQTYLDTNLSRCFNCNNYCYACSGSSTNCSVCDTSGFFIGYLLNTSCLVDCGPGYYEDSNGTVGPNLCLNCTTQCATCNFNATHCLSCDPGFYLYNYTCGTTCPQPQYFADNNTWACLDCSIFCVRLTMNLYFKNNLKEELVCDLIFPQALNWTATDVQNFISISVVDPLITISSFDVTYTVVTPTVMRITLTPKGYIFIYNATFTFTTMPFNGTLHKAINGYPFADVNYATSKAISWFLIKAPALSDMEKNIIDSFSKFSNDALNFTTLPFVQQIKKAGFFAMVLSGAQATSTSCLVNTIPAQNFYQGVRLWASFVFFDVPAWQQNSHKTKLIVAPTAGQVIDDARLLQQIGQQHKNRTLFDTSKIEWRFQRTGHTSFFIFDTYMNIFLMVLCWVLVSIANKCRSHKLQNKKYVAIFYTFLHKVHEVSIFYISLSTLLEWMYFDAASFQRWISMILCIICNVYFLIYQLYIYYDMINYPTAEIGNKKYEYYCIKYGSLLRNIRFIEYDKTQPWSMKHWFRPYNYHILSYYKKFLMMIALPIFYQTLYMQTYCLIGIQLFQIIRFILVWPFRSKVKNFIRLGLQIVLLLFFASIMLQTMFVKQIMLSDPNTLQTSVIWFYNIGWIGFVMVFVFNIGHLALFIYGIIVGCRRSNAQMMDQARKFYYMQRLKTYEDQNEDVPLTLVNKWVKLGNLNNRRYDELPDINLRIQQFRISRTAGYTYQIQIRKLVQIFMNIQFNYQKQNNITASKKLNKRFNLDKKLSPTFFYLIDELYKKHTSTMDFEYLVIKTFQRVAQSSFKAGDKIQFKPQIMSQKIELQSYAGQKKVIKLQKILPGFPISYQDLKHYL